MQNKSQQSQNTCSLLSQQWQYKI